MKKMDFDFGVGGGFGTEVGFVEDVVDDDSGAGSGFGTEVDFVEDVGDDGTGTLEGSGRTEVGFVEDFAGDGTGTLEGSGRTDVGFVEDLAGDDSGAGSGFGTEVDFVEEKFFDGTGALEGSGRTEVGFVEDFAGDGTGTLEGSDAGEETDEFFQEEIFFAQRQAADADDFVDEDFVTFEAVKSFGIKYLFPWQRIVIQNILDAAGVCGDEEDGLENDELLEGGFCNDRDGFTEGAFCNEIDDLETDTAFVNSAGASLTESAFRNERSVLETDTAFVNGAGASSTESAFRNEIDDLETRAAFVNSAGASSTGDAFRNEESVLKTGVGFVNRGGASSTESAFRNDGAILETDTAFVNSAAQSSKDDAFRNEESDFETDTAFVNSAAPSSTDDVFRNENAAFETSSSFVKSALPDEASNSKTAPSFFDLPPSSSARQIVLLPTGAGKSLCFLTPALLLPGPTLVLYPLLALMSDQKRRMDEGKMKSVVFRGGQTEEEREENFLAIKDGAKIILANPEVLQNENLVKRLSKCNICHIAIDEAHCVWEWGSTFRPAYLTLGKIIKALNVKVVTAFTATASPLVLEKISQVLFDGNAHIVRSDGDRPNIHYNVINTYAKKKEVFRLAVTEKKPLIVFCGTRKKSEDMARQLSQFYGSDKVKFYHAGMEREEKDAVEKWFYPKEDAILCCTCAFGMGVDKKDIRTVIHLEASPTAEAYIQEAGRGGRDGSVANAILLWSPSDREKFLKFPEDSRERVLMNYAESKTCRREVLLNALGDQLTYCDGCDVCQRGGPAPFAKDGEYLLKFLSKHKKLFKRERLEAEIQNAFNEKDLPFFKKNIWEDSDIREMINQLERENKIYACKWPWRKLYSVRKIK